MSDAKIQVDKEEIQTAVKSTLLRKDVIVIVAIGLVLVGLHFYMSKAAPQSVAQPGTQAWCVMNGQKDYRELMKEYGFTLPQAKILLQKCEAIFEELGGPNAKIFEEHQKGMQNQTTPVTVGGY